MVFKFVKLTALLCFGLAICPAMPACAGAASTAVISPPGIKTPADPTVLKSDSSPRISDQKALEIVMAAFPEYRGLQSQVSLMPFKGQDKMAWNISLYRQSGSRVSGPYLLQAMVDANTGEILNVGVFGEPAARGDQIFSRDRARQIAENLARKLQPVKFSQMKLDTDTSPIQYLQPQKTLNISYQFQWKRTANGIRVGNDGIVITVDALSGTITQYNYTWQDNINIPGAAAPAISAKEALEKLISQAGMLLSYQVPNNVSSGGVPQAKLFYGVNSGYRVIDAVTGEVLDFQGQPVKPEELKLFDRIPAASGDMNPPASGNMSITQPAALEKAEKFFKALGYEGKVQRMGGGFNSGEPFGREDYWSFTIKKPDAVNIFGPPPIVSIEVLSGRVAQFNSQGTFQNLSVKQENQSVTKEGALKTAMAFIQKVEPELTGYLALQKTINWARDNNYLFRFARVVNGIPFPEDGISISVNREGSIINYSCQWHLVNFPPAVAKISSADASGKILAASQLNLVYFLPRYENGSAGNPILAYEPGLAGMESIDANTGEVADLDENPLLADKNVHYDFGGSWASQQLQLLADSGLLPPPEKFSPSGPVTRRDGMRIMVAAAGHNYSGYQPDSGGFKDIKAGDPDYSTFRQAVDMGIVTDGGNFLPGDKLDRITLANWLVNCLGYGEIASMPNNICSPFKDISGLSQKDRNAIGLVYGLGLLEGDGTLNFRPGAPLTWEELAAVIIKAAPVLRNHAAIR